MRNFPKIPNYVSVPLLGITGSVVYGYFFFRDEVPLSKRSRLLLTSANFERELGNRSYRNLRNQYKNNVLPPNHPASRTVARVGSHISLAAERFHEGKYVVGKDSCTYTVVRSNEANAFVLPNNHVFVLTGLFKFIRNEDDLAAVLGHEMAHNVCRHAGEKMSGKFLSLAFGQALWAIDPTGMLYNLFMPASVLFHELPHSREAEVEADKLGLFLMADACFDPRAAPRVFESMKRADKSSSGDSFLSTHPTYDQRIENFSKWMPEAMSRFNGTEQQARQCKRIRHEMGQARKQALQDYSKK